MKTRVRLSIFACLTVLAVSLPADNCTAAFVFSDVSCTANSVTFTIDGDTSGLATLGNNAQFSLRFGGGLWAGLTGFSANTWSQSVFDNETIQNPGNTGTFGASVPYTWSSYTTSLADAVATNRTVTLTFGNNYLDPTATGGFVEFYWGNGNSSSAQTLLGTSQKSIPEPGSLLVLAMGTIAFNSRRQKTIANG